MIVLLLDAAGAFCLSRLIPNWIGLLLAAIVLGLVNGLVASYLTAFAFDEFMSKDDHARVMLNAAVVHPMVCIALSAWFRYRLTRRR